MSLFGKYLQVIFELVLNPISMKNVNPTKHLAILILCSLVLISCDDEYPSPKGYKYNQGDLPDSPVNLEDFNSVYDDYNITAPSRGAFVAFCFSTNRKSNGNEFDVIYEPMNIDFNKTSGILTVTNDYANNYYLAENYGVIRNGLNKINTLGNEFGPYLIPEYDFDDLFFTLLYASDVTGNFQINYTSNKSDTDFSDIKPIEFLNSEFDDLYPTFNSDRSKIYFCSNRDNDKFDIYYTNISTPENELELILSDTSAHIISKEAIISSTSDDKCPFVYDDTLIFASNRDGGFGGFDLYYCKFENNKWGEPINFGSKINSEFDEYRPILIDEDVNDTETMMVFSSNRNGGKGGFDLYYVGVIIE